MERGRGRKILKNQRGADPGLEVIPLKYASITLLNLITHKHPTERFASHISSLSLGQNVPLNVPFPPPVISA